MNAATKIQLKCLRRRHDGLLELTNESFLVHDIPPLMKNKNPHAGSDFDDFLKEEGILDEVEARALKRALALSVQDLMAKKKLTKTSMAVRMSTSRAAVNRLLDGTNTSVTLGTLNKAAKALGKKVRIELVSA
jgi:antitoxin HicB